MPGVAGSRSPPSTPSHRVGRAGPSARLKSLEVERRHRPRTGSEEQDPVPGSPIACTSGAARIVPGRKIRIRCQTESAARARKLSPQCQGPSIPRGGRSSGVLAPDQKSRTRCQKGFSRRCESEPHARIGSEEQNPVPRVVAEYTRIGSEEQDQVPAVDGSVKTDGPRPHEHPLRSKWEIFVISAFIVGILGGIGYAIEAVVRVLIWIG